jgi:hypothetical protein
MKMPNLFFLMHMIFLLICCSKEEQADKDLTGEAAEAVYDETGCLYTAYKNLVMAGYQGWFAAEGDDSDRGWYHYRNTCGLLAREPGGFTERIILV